jgi:fido (protein-threonine AMPylation protein)
LVLQWQFGWVHKWTGCEHFLVPRAKLSVSSFLGGVSCGPWGSAGSKPWTARNIVIRAAITIGTLASGFQFFADGNTQVLSGISSYNGQGVPAFQLFWPDNTQARLNRISDFGFQTNKVVAKSSSDIIIAFFPIDRFLTNSLKAIYKKDPAAFFNPLQMLLDDKESQLFLPMFKGVGGITMTAKNDAIKATILEAFSHYENTSTAQKTAHSGPITANDAAILGALAKVSLTNIRVIVGGIMTVDTLAVPAVVSSVIAGANAGILARSAHREWYRELFQPCVAAGLIEAGALAGYRNDAVYLRTSRYVPPRWEAVRDAIPALFDLLEREPEASVRAVLGHWMFGYIHPYPDGNGRMARFLMNAMLASGGYLWSVIEVGDRTGYFSALDRASIEMDIQPFATFIATSVARCAKQSYT